MVDMAVGSKRVYRRRVRRARPKTVKAIAKRVVRRQLGRTLERKRFVIDVPDLFVQSTSVYAMAPLQWLTQGTAENQRVGDKISDVYLKLRISYMHKGIVSGGTANWSSSKLRVLVIKTSRQLTDYTPNTAPNQASTLLNLFTNPGVTSVSEVNTHDYTVLADRTIDSHAIIPVTNWTAFTGYGTQAVAKLNIPLAKQYQYTDAGNLGRNRNIYVVVTSSLPSSNQAYAGMAQIAGTLTWHDA